MCSRTGDPIPDLVCDLEGICLWEKEHLVGKEYGGAVETQTQNRVGVLNGLMWKTTKETRAKSFRLCGQKNLQLDAAVVQETNVHVVGEDTFLLL